MKHGKSSVGYDEQGGHGISKCDNCVYFINPDTCRMVEGNVNDDALCDLFEHDNYKLAESNLIKGFLSKMATPQRGRIVSDRSLLMDDDITQDPAMLKKRNNKAHTKSMPEKTTSNPDSHEVEKNGMFKALKTILKLEE